MRSNQRRNFRETFGRRAAVAATTGALALASVAVGTTLGASPASADTAPTTLLSVDFEDSTTGPLQQSGAAGAVVDDGTGNRVYRITDRTQSYDALETPATLLAGLNAGAVVTVTMKAKLAPGTTGAYKARWVKKPGYNWVSNNTDLSSTAWTTITGSYTTDATKDVTFYTGTGADSGDTFTYLLDDITVTAVDGNPATMQDDLTPIKDTLDFPIGAAVSSPQTTGEAGKLLTRHFDQVTPENYMKPEAWYTTDASHTFVTENTEADALMDYAEATGARVYGHTLAWYQQTPDWFFQDDNGDWLTADDPDDVTLLHQRLLDHIDNVAKYLSDKHGKFGSATNRLVAFDVVNEAVSDNVGDADNLRQSHWYQVLGKDYIKDAFEEADRVFNDVYADPAADRPVKLFYNDYNTEQAGKRGRVLELVDDLIAVEHVPIDGIGHQFHVTMATPVDNLKAAIDAFADTTTDASAGGHALYQAITELDVPTGTPESEAKNIDQGYYYKDVFDMLRAEHAAGHDIFSATVWGLTDDQSWRKDSGAPLLFDQALQAKPAYYGVTDQTLPAKQRSALVFQQDADDVGPGDVDATTDVEWGQLPLQAVGAHAGFQVRWSGDHLTAYVSSTDDSLNAADAATLKWSNGGAVQTITVKRDGTVVGGCLAARVRSTATGWAAVVDLPLAGLTSSSTPKLDVAVTDGARTTGWNTPGNLGTLTLVEPLSFTRIPQAATAPTIDGTKDPVWNGAATVTTSKRITGDVDGAKATVHQLWKGGYLYLLADVTDRTPNNTSPNAYERDSVEIFTDPGNAKNGAYRGADAQMRIGANGDISFGGGDTEAAQQARLESAVVTNDHGYVVEARIDLGATSTGVGAFEGVDYEVNDGDGAGRIANFGWAEPTGTAYQTTSRWGVAQLVDSATTGGATVGDGSIVATCPATTPKPSAPVVTKQPKRSVKVKAGRKFHLTVAAQGATTVTWQVWNKRKHRWVAVVHPHRLTLTRRAVPGRDGARFRAVLAGPGGTVVSRAVVVHVKG